MRRTRSLVLISACSLWGIVLATGSPALGSPGPSTGAEPARPAQADGIRLVRGASGAMEVRVDGPAGVFRIVGLGAGPGDLVSVAWRDLDADGDLDVVVVNRSSGEVFNIVAPAGGFPVVIDLGESGEPTSGSRRGDNDNFGYGGNDPPPCEFFDNREADDHVFDYELIDGDQVNVWEHAFAVLGEPTGVKFVTWEMFSDFEASTIDFDGHTLNFATEPFSFCPTGPGGLRRVFFLTGSDAFIASDGVVMVTFTENGDDIALDRSQLGVTFAAA